MTEWFDMTEDEERAIAAFMTRVASLPTAAVARPDAMQLWWKAQLVRRWEAERRAQLPLDLMQPVEIVVGLAATVFLLYLSLPRFF